MVFRRAFFAIAFLTALLSPLRAEELQGIQPIDRLGEIKKKFPNASFTRIKAVWVTSEQDFFSMSGSGFPGILYLAFSDHRPSYRKQLSEQPEPADDDESAKKLPSLLRGWASQSDDDALAIDWVRWVPAQPIPLQRYKSKYGEPSKCDFASSDMQPYCEWTAKALHANLTDDQKQVVAVESNFTREEHRAAWKRKVGYVPDWLKDASDKPDTTDKVSEKPQKQR